ncbi:hypothetical protein AB751O23_AA_00340 [Chlamydiales bacterium SCGC AB-751-O23]|jgi:uncharacterized protein|nr:hypothetical protein AB751O23_AA_00340 [Chlamydiales bacterium SCGC AB-751-O23]
MTDDPLAAMEQTIVEEEIKNPSSPIESDGHLYFESSITNATVNAKGNIIIGDNCEGCTLNSTLGSVFILYGSSHNAKVAAGKNIYVKHVVNSNLDAKGDIIIENTSMDSQLIAGGTIVTESKVGQIIGGSSKAATLIKSFAIGNKRQRETSVEVESESGIVEAEIVYSEVKVKVHEASELITKENKQIRYTAEGKRLISEHFH